MYQHMAHIDDIPPRDIGMGSRELFRQFICRLTNDCHIVEYSKLKQFVTGERLKIDPLLKLHDVVNALHHMEQPRAVFNSLSHR